MGRTKARKKRLRPKKSKGIKAGQNKGLTTNFRLDNLITGRS
jgi:hypothetical protein